MDEATVSTAGADWTYAPPGAASRDPRAPLSPASIRAARWLFRVLQLAPAAAAGVASSEFFRPRRKAAAKPQPWERSTHLLEGKRIQVYVTGRGRPVLFVHGWESSAWRMHLAIEALASNGYRCVSFDLPAHGNSSGQSTDLLEITRVMQQLQRSFGPFEAAVGHSFGGVCVANALRVGVGFSRIVLLSTPASIAMMAEKYAFTLGLGASAKDRFLRGVGRRLGAFGSRSELDPLRNLAAAPVPCLLVHDVHDPIVPFQEALQLRTAHPDVRLLGTEQLGHNGVVRSPDVLAACVEFLQGSALSTVTRVA